MLLVNDRELLTRFRKGDSQAMQRVFSYYCQPLAEFLQRGGSFHQAGSIQRIAGIHDRHELHDIVSETFKRAFEEPARHAYSGISSFGGYLQTIARNVRLDRLRQDARIQRTRASYEMETSHSSKQPTPERAYHQVELANLVRRFSEELSNPDRQLVRLRYQEGHSQEETARLLGESRRWVRDHEYSIRRRLMTYLEGTGYL